jgi:O-antigen/teichoic acid export membrane protein
VIDQGVVSLGAFVLNIILARRLPPAEYGVFSLLFGGLLSLQMINSALLFHPLSVRFGLADEKKQAQLLAATAVMLAFALLPLSFLVGAALLVFGRGDLVPSAIASFVLWQMQEAMRRGLLANFRHDRAVIGDAVSYLGQAVVMLVLAATDSLTLSNALYSMAATSGLAALIQARQLGLSLRVPLGLSRTFCEFWSIGSLVLAYGIVSVMRTQITPWVLAATSGPGSAASFQAVLNVLNAANPIVLGLTNVIPQTAAHARANGNVAAWRSARAYIFMGVPLTFSYYVAALLAPDFILHIFYGTGSSYLELSYAVRLLVIAWMLSYWADMICSFLHGIDSARVALVINTIGAIAVAILILPMTEVLGLTGTCITMVVAHLARLLASLLGLKWTTRNGLSNPV